MKETFKKEFTVGAALNAAQIEEKEPNAAALVPKQFNTITSENIMKCEVIHPEWDKYNFTLADKFVEYGKKNDMFVIGHTLIWHSQLSPFVHKIKSSDSLLQFFTNHINTVAGRYAGKVNGWDVVNEALNEDGTMRKSIFLEKLGEDYIVKAFQLAQKAAPNTELYYNDYNIEQPKKRAGVIAIIKKLQAAGVRIDGVGIQGHWRAGKVPLKDIEESIIEYAALGMKVMITELDLGVLPNPWDGDAADVNLIAEYTAKMNPYPSGLPDSMQVKLTKSYEDLFSLFLKYKDKISRITFWGVNDGQSWLNGWPIRGRTNYPLLFDREFKPKPAFFKVIETKTKPEVKKAF
ncbi:MAG: endo-1,4-beta-xylanase [Chitinophagaceae bacterium]|nr:endo-1,4-beta-xylanase [Chitinophagaceae bacterium]